MMKLWGWAHDNNSDPDMKARIIGEQTKIQTFNFLWTSAFSTFPGEKKTASTWPPLQVALQSETDVFTLLPATSTSETARVLIRTDAPKVTKRQREQTKEEVLSHSDNLRYRLQIAELYAVDAQKNAKLSVTVLRGIQSERNASLHWTKVTQVAVNLELQAPSLPCCHKMPSRYFGGIAQPEHYSNDENFYRQIYFESVDTIAN